MKIFIMNFSHEYIQPRIFPKLQYTVKLRLENNSPKSSPVIILCHKVLSEVLEDVNLGNQNNPS